MMQKAFNQGPQQPAPNYVGSPLADVPNNLSTAISLKELEAYFSSVYPNQVPLCLQPNESFIKGGSDPLDFIFIYKNEGIISEIDSLTIPRHFHYIGLGLSDIHNYNQTYMLDRMRRASSDIEKVLTMLGIQPLKELYPPQGPSSEKLNGFGFELTFRIKCHSLEEWESDPPKWPGLVMQALAKYVFQTKNIFRVGDHAAWHCALDYEDSKIEHMLMTLDPQLKEIETSLGKVRFIQLVGVFQEELQAARELNVEEILNIMKERDETGGHYLVTDMRRIESIFVLNPENRERIGSAISQMGSDLTQISAKHSYSSSKPRWFKNIEEGVNGDDINDSKSMERESLLCHDKSTFVVTGVERGSLLNRVGSVMSFQDYPLPSSNRNPSRASTESELKIENAELVETRFFDSVYLLLTFESIKILPVALKGRLAHGRAFSFQSFDGDLLTTLVPEGAGFDALVNSEKPFVKKGSWLQIYVSANLRQEMEDTIRIDFVNGMEFTQPKNYCWPEHKLYISVVKEFN